MHVEHDVCVVQTTLTLLHTFVLYYDAASGRGKGGGAKSPLTNPHPHTLKAYPAPARPIDVAQRLGQARCIKDVELQGEKRSGRRDGIDGCYLTCV